MQKAPTASIFRRPAPEYLWHNTLSQIPTVLGRLAYLASLRNSNSGRYEHHGFAQAYGADTADYAMRESHETTFAEWLRQDLAAQKSDLLNFLRGLPEDTAATVDIWLRLAPYRSYVPTAVRAPERLLFLSDLEVLLETLRAEFGVSRPDQDA